MSKSRIQDVSPGSLEAIKWVALLLMTGDHINKYLCQGQYPWLLNTGRMVMPMFMTVLACNLARPGSLEKGIYQRVMKRLAVFGTAASVPYMALGHLSWGWWPLNIMGTLLAVTAILFLLERGRLWDRLGALLVFVLAGAVVEYWWPGLLLGLAAWRGFRKPSVPSALLYLLGLLSLGLINTNQWALMAAPAMMGVVALRPAVPRVGKIFYWYYPAHLGGIILAKAIW